MAFRFSSKRTKQWKVVVIAFLVATTFWFFNALNKNYTTSLTYPVFFEFDRDSFMTVRPLPKQITLDITGGGWSLLRRTAIFVPRPVTIAIEQPTEKRILNWLELLSDVRGQFPELQINQILQDTLRLKIEPRVFRKVPLKLDSSSIRLAKNYRLIGKIDIARDSVVLEGPQSYFDTLDQGAYSIPFPEELLSDDFDDEIPVMVPHPLVRPRPKEVTVRLTVRAVRSRTVRVPVRNQAGDTTGATASVIYWQLADDFQEVAKTAFDVRVLEVSDKDGKSSSALVLQDFPLSVLDAALVKEQLEEDE